MIEKNYEDEFSDYELSQSIYFKNLDLYLKRDKGGAWLSKDGTNWIQGKEVEEVADHRIRLLNLRKKLEKL